MLEFFLIIIFLGIIFVFLNSLESDKKTPTPAGSTPAETTPVTLLPASDAIIPVPSPSPGGDRLIPVTLLPAGDGTVPVTLFACR